MVKKRLRFAIFGNATKAIASVHVWNMLRYLTRNEAEIYIEQGLYNALKSKFTTKIDVTGVFEGVNFDVDFVISLGGDGTFLKAARMVGSKQIPIIGVNMGRLGFLANVAPTDIIPMLDDVYENNIEVEERVVIQLSAEGQILDGCPFALNDIAILKRDNAAMITVKVSINGAFLATYLADGLVISTPTGSTAYSLSVGGPIIVPQAGIISITPVAPHSLNIRPIVISDKVEIKLEVESRSHNFLAAIDGRSEKMREGVILHINRAPHKVRIVKRHGQTFFGTLREKLMWGADARKN